MRRKDREVTDSMKIENIISRCTCCRIGFHDDGEVYIVPLNFGYETKGDAYIFYFHNAVLQIQKEEHMEKTHLI